MLIDDVGIMLDGIKTVTEILINEVIDISKVL